MKIATLLPLVYRHLDAFYTMCLSAALLSSYNSNAFEQDARGITALLGEAFDLPTDTVDTFTQAILGDMMAVGLIADYHALAVTELLSEHDKDRLPLYEIKGRVLEEVAVCEAAQALAADDRIGMSIRAAMNYDGFHHPYEAAWRLWQLERSASCGNVLATRQVAMMRWLGIGCEAHIDTAETALLTCFLWGDEIAALLLDHLYTVTHRRPLNFSRIHGKPRGKATAYRTLAELIGEHLIFPTHNPSINPLLAQQLIDNRLSQQDKEDSILHFHDHTWRGHVRHTRDMPRPIGFQVTQYA